MSFRVQLNHGTVVINRNESLTGTDLAESSEDYAEWHMYNVPEVKIMEPLSIQTAKNKAASQASASPTSGKKTAQEG